MRRPVEKIKYMGEGRFIPAGSIVKHTDKGVRGIVEALFQRGYAAEWSCEGGEEHMSPVGRVTLRDEAPLSREDLQEIRELVESYTDVPFSIKRWYPLTRGYSFKEFYYAILFQGPLSGGPPAFGEYVPKRDRKALMEEFGGLDSDLYDEIEEK